MSDSRYCQVVEYHIQSCRKEIDRIGTAAKDEEYDPDTDARLPYYDPSIFDRVKSFMLDHFCQRDRWHPENAHYYPMCNFGLHHDGAGGLELHVRNGWHHCEFFFAADGTVTMHLYMKPWEFQFWLDGENPIEYVKDYLNLVWDEERSRRPLQQWPTDVHNFSSVVRNYAVGKVKENEYQRDRQAFVKKFELALDQYVEESKGLARNWMER